MPIYWSYNWQIMLQHFWISCSVFGICRLQKQFDLQYIQRERKCVWKTVTGKINSILKDVTSKLTTLQTGSLCFLHCDGAMVPTKIIYHVHDTILGLYWFPCFRLGDPPKLWLPNQSRSVSKYSITESILLTVWTK